MFSKEGKTLSSQNWFLEYWYIRIQAFGITNKVQAWEWNQCELWSNNSKRNYLSSLLIYDVRIYALFYQFILAISHDRHHIYQGGWIQLSVAYSVNKLVILLFCSRNWTWDNTKIESKIRDIFRSADCFMVKLLVELLIVCCRALTLVFGTYIYFKF